jgi:hypothetical protein
MRLLVLIYIVLTLALAASVANNDIWHAIVIVVASLVGFAGGSGMRSSFYVGKVAFGIVIGLALFAIGGGLGLYLIGTAELFGFKFSSDNWVILGVVVGFITTRRDDAGYQRAKRVNEATEELKLEKWQTAINDFGEILERYPLMVLSDSHLPLPKEEMKEAFKAAWLRVDDPLMKEMIEAAYMELSRFRTGVSEPVNLDLEVFTDASREDFLRQILSRRSSLEIWKPVNEDAVRLKQEFDTFKASVKY